MTVFKWILLILVIGLAVYLVIDTTIYAVKKIKAKKKAQLEKQNEVIDNNDSK